MGSPVSPVSRETIFTALFAKVWAAYAWKNDQAMARRLKLWADVDPVNRPALFQFEGGEEGYTYSQEPMPKRTLRPTLFVYTTAPEGVIGSTLQNNILDAIETALAPSYADQLGGGGMRQTLGGLVHYCRINGSIFRDPGDLDNDGMLRIPLEILVP